MACWDEAQIRHVLFCEGMRGVASHPGPDKNSLESDRRQENVQPGRFLF